MSGAENALEDAVHLFEMVVEIEQGFERKILEAFRQ